MSFEASSTITAREDGSYDWIVPEGWEQGRGAFGGLVVGALVRAILRAEGDPGRTLRSLSADICAPVATGPATITAEILRRGRGVTFIDARVLQRGGVAAHASAVVAVTRDATTDREPSPPIVDAPPIPPDAKPFAFGDFGPRFARNYDYVVTGPMPFSGSDRAIISLGVRERVPPARLDAAAIAGLLDAPWPTAFSAWTAPRPIGTIAFTMQLLVDPASIPADAFLDFRSRAEALEGGYLVEFRELWHAGRRVAMNQQTIAVI